MKTRDYILCGAYLLAALVICLTIVFLNCTREPSKTIIIPPSIADSVRYGTTMGGITVDLYPMPMTRTTGFSDRFGCWNDYLVIGDCAVPQALIDSGKVRRNDMILAIIPGLPPRLYRVKDKCGTDALDIWTPYPELQDLMNFHCRTWIIRFYPQ